MASPASMTKAFACFRVIYLDRLTGRFVVVDVGSAKVGVVMLVVVLVMADSTACGIMVDSVIV